MYCNYDLDLRLRTHKVAPTVFSPESNATLVGPRNSDDEAMAIIPARLMVR